LNLPTVAVHDLVAKDDDLVVGTHGRSIWILDDLTPFRETTSAVLGSSMQLFKPREAYRWHYSDSMRDPTAGQNPPRGVVITYYLKDKPKDVAIEIRDAQKRLVRRYSSVAPPPVGADDNEPEPKPALKLETGIQSATWDLRWEGAERIKNAKIDWGDPSRGPIVVPGAYTATLIVDGRTATTPLVVKPDPRSQVSQADLEAQQAFALEVRDAFSRVTATVNQLRLVGDQLKARNAALRDQAAAAPLVKASEAALVKIVAFEEDIHNPRAEVVYDILAMEGGAKLYSRLSPLLDFVTDGDGPPTQGAREVFADQKRELEQWKARVKQFMSGEVTALNAQASQLGVTFVVVQ
jgi:hypothetical protein